jgi:enoyl-CoA hydratase/carnithine racemase
MLELRQEGPVYRVTLNRPDVRNAFNDELIAALTEAYANLPAGTRVVVLSGNGKGFCAGGDLEWMRKAAAYTTEQNHADAMRLATLFQTVADCPALTIARVHGACFGGGCGLVAASDVAIASPDALFAFSEVRLGLIPGTISLFVVPKIGAGHARALFATGEAFGAERALRIGLIHEVGDLDELVAAKVKQALSVGPNAVREAKRLVHEFPIPAEESALRLAMARAGEEGREGVAAFLEKRRASFVVAD